MNGMNFKPFISKVLNSLSDEDMEALATLIDSHSNVFKNRSLIAGNLTNDDKGVGLYTIQLENSVIKSGYLIYNNSYCVLLSYLSNSDRVMEYKINPTTNTYEPIKEFLTTDYLRHEVAIKAVEAGQVAGYVTEEELQEKASVVMQVNDIRGLTKAQLDSLKAGDIVNKKTGNALHSYRVSYKGEGAGTGICLTYTDAGYSETVSYDRSGDNWVYNSADVSSLEEYAKVHHYNEADILTEEILNLIKDGDVICVNQMSFIVKKTNLTTHYIIQGGFAYIAEGDPYIVLLSWDSADDTTGLTLTSAKLALAV